MNLDAMWEALAAYQPHAGNYGFGREWLRMTTERTYEAAYQAASAASDAAGWSNTVSDAAQAAETAMTALGAPAIVISAMASAVEHENRRTNHEP